MKLCCQEADEHRCQICSQEKRESEYRMRLQRPAGSELNKPAKLELKLLRRRLKKLSRALKLVEFQSNMRISALEIKYRERDSSSRPLFYDLEFFGKPVQSKKQ